MATRNIARKPKRPKIAGPIIGLVAAMVSITVLVRFAGTDSIAVHLYYLPIMYAGYYFGDYGAILASLLSTLLTGPHMAARYTTTGDAVPQAMYDSLVRLCIFYVVGLAASRTSIELKRRASEAHRLYEVARSITSSLRLSEVLDLIVVNAMKVMDAKGSVIRLLNEDTDELEVHAMAGLSDEYWDKGKVVGTASPVNRRVIAGEAVQILDVTEEEGHQYPDAARAEGLTSVLTVPLRAKSGTRGVLRVYSKRRHRFSPHEVELLSTFADQAGVAIENAELYENIRQNYYETVRALTTAVEAKDAATYNHSERVTQLADRLAEAIGMDEMDREMLRFGCVLHDIGKIGVDEAALEARSGESAEQVFYRMHPLIGVSILQPIGFLEPSLPIVRYHHERWDGKGFPVGVEGKDIPLAARLVAVVDTFDRLQNPGGRTLPTKQVLLDVVSRAGTEFDPEIVGKFHRMMLAEIEAKENASAAGDGALPDLESDDE